MSKYTVELRFIIEQACNERGLDWHDPRNWTTEGVAKKVGLWYYPIFDPTYKDGLTQKIIRHFWVREIGLETVELFKWYMDMKMSEIMPYYNQLYLSEKIKFDPLSTRDMSYTDNWTIDNDRDTDSTWKSKTDSTGKSHDSEVFQDTPMDLLDEPSPNPVESLDYATNVTYNDDENEAHQNANGDNSVDETRKEVGGRVKTEKGYDRPGAEMLKLYRDSFLNIDMMIINELETLFMGIG